MFRALLAFAVAFSLGSPVAQPWAEALLRLTQALPTAGDAGNHWDPDGGAVPNPGGPSSQNGAESDAGNLWDPNG